MSVPVFMIAAPTISPWTVPIAAYGAVAATLALAVSVLNWWRLRPDMFLIERLAEFRAQDGGWVAQRLVIHVCNAGAAGVTLGAVGIVPTFVTSLSGDGRPSYWSGPEVPCRLDGSDIKAWTVDLTALQKAVSPNRPSHDSALLGLKVGVDWFGRKLPWRPRKRTKFLDLDLASRGAETSETTTEVD